MNSATDLRSAIEAVKLRGVFARRFAAESGRYGIDENDVGEIESGVRVVDQAIRWLRLFTVRAHLDALWSQSARDAATPKTIPGLH